MPSPRLVFVDNTASDIQYGPSWTQQTSTSSAVYLGTLQTTNTNTSFTFKFSGTAINAVGSIDIKKVNGMQDPRWECFVDQQPVKNGDVGDGFVEDAWLLCSAHDLSDTDHTFTLNTVSQGSNFYFDSLSYQPSLNVDISEKVVRINNDDEAIRYTGKFGTLGDFANMTSESGASVLVDFVGKSLTWYGFIPKELPHTSTTATYSIDGGSPNTFRLSGLPDAKSSSRRNQVFFTTPDLKPGPHTIVVTHEGNTGTTPLVLDYLLVTNATISSSDNVAHKGVPVGPLVGGVIGGLVLIGLLCYIVYFYTRRRELAKRWRRQTMRGVDASFRDPGIDALYVSPSKSNRRFALRPGHSPSNSDASVTAPLFTSLPSDADDSPEPSASVAAYTSHQNQLFLSIPESAGTVDHFNLPSPTPITRDYEHARTMLALQGPAAEGALQEVPRASTPRLVHQYNHHVDSGYRFTMRPDESLEASLVQVADIPPGHNK